MDTAGYITPTRSLRHTEKIRHYGLLFPSLPKIHLNHRFYALTGGVNYCSLNLHATDRTMPRPRSGQPQIQLHIIRHRTGRPADSIFLATTCTPVKHTPLSSHRKKEAYAGTNQNAPGLTAYHYAPDKKQVRPTSSMRQATPFYLVFIGLFRLIYRVGEIPVSLVKQLVVERSITQV